MLRPGTFALTALLAGLTALGPLTTDLYLPSLPDIALRLQTSAAEVQLTISSYLIGFAVGQIFYGPMSDRYGRKIVLMGALALYAVATLACAFSTSIEMLIAARAAQGFGGSGGIVLARAIGRDIYSGARAGRELSLMASVMALGPVLAPILGGVLQTAFGWRAGFLALLIAGVTVAFVIWLLMPETLAKRSPEPFSLRSMFRSFGVVARNGAYLSYLGLGALSFAGLFAWISAASFVLQDLYGLTPFSFGVAFAVGAVGYMTGAGLSARMVIRLGLDGLIGLGGLCCAVGGLGMVASVAFGLTSALSLVLPMALYLAGLGMVLSQSIAGAMTPFPERAGAASSLFGFVQQGLAALVGALIGRVLGVVSASLAASLGGLFVAGTVVLVVLIGLYTELGPLQSVVLGATIGVVGPVGDLFESLVKRDVQIKDSGRGIPGHGGVLARFDALRWPAVAGDFVVTGGGGVLVVGRARGGRAR
jgi:DHA1 family bicyclomycin/chloramphenicol resistance-like MFS transporter